jgi:hypothetical protein
LQCLRAVRCAPTTVMPCRSRRPRAASRKRGLSSTIRQRSGMV